MEFRFYSLPTVRRVCLFRPPLDLDYSNLHYIYCRYVLGEAIATYMAREPP